MSLLLSLNFSKPVLENSQKHQKGQKLPHGMVYGKECGKKC